jgi:hypothetical protein
MGGADFAYLNGWIRNTARSLWISLSIAAMFLPILVWLAGIFVGPGVIAWSAVAALEAALFIGLYRSLSNLVASRTFGHGLPPPTRTAAAARRPARSSSDKT